METMNTLLNRMNIRFYFPIDFAIIVLISAWIDLFSFFIFRFFCLSAVCLLPFPFRFLHRKTNFNEQTNRGKKQLNVFCNGQSTNRFTRCHCCCSRLWFFSCSRFVSTLCFWPNDSEQLKRRKGKTLFDHRTFFALLTFVSFVFDVRFRTHSDIRKQSTECAVRSSLDFMFIVFRFRFCVCFFSSVHDYISVAIFVAMSVNLEKMENHVTARNAQCYRLCVYVFVVLYVCALCPFVCAARETFILKIDQ